MSELHKGSKNTGPNVEAKDGERGPLCSNKASVRSPSLDFINPNDPDISDAIVRDYLASILIDAYLDHKANERNKAKRSLAKASSDLLPGFDERAA